MWPVPDMEGETVSEDEHAAARTAVATIAVESRV
jgi:hypothetical protein